MAPVIIPTVHIGIEKGGVQNQLPNLKLNTIKEDIPGMEIKPITL
jgi:hypothetical protein